MSDIILKFSNDRGWNNDDPCELTSALFVEMGELADHYNWKHKFGDMTEEEKKEVGFEFVDVIFYLFQLANKSHIDIEKYFDEKVPLLAEKYPAVRDEKLHDQRKKEYRITGKNRLYK